MNKPIKIAMTLASTALVIALAGCGSSSKTASQPMTNMTTSSTSNTDRATATAASGPHNAADVSFATDMIPHHAQAVQMADMVLSKATNGEVKSMATDIKAAQDPEIVEMTGWLKSWGAPVPDSSMGGMMSRGTGMMSAADMASLDKGMGAAFDRMWVQMMVTHHQGAVAMAKTELAGGQSTDAKKLAQSIVTSQTAQIAQLQQLLQKLPA